MIKFVLHWSWIENTDSILAGDTGVGRKKMVDDNEHHVHIHFFFW